MQWKLERFTVSPKGGSLQIHWLISSPLAHLGCSAACAVSVFLSFPDKATHTEQSEHTDIPFCTIFSASTPSVSSAARAYICFIPHVHGQVEEVVPAIREESRKWQGDFRRFSDWRQPLISHDKIECFRYFQLTRAPHKPEKPSASISSSKEFCHAASMSGVQLRLTHDFCI